MPKNPPGAHRKKRLKMLEVQPHWLASEATVGKYLVDAIALELFYRGAAVSSSREGEFIRLVREEVSLAAHYAVMSARIHLVRRPEKMRQTKRLFDDLQQILLRLNRNKDLDPTDLLIYTQPNPGTLIRPDQKRLLSVLQLFKDEIRHYLASYRVYSNRGGNKDRLTGQFINEIFDLWCRCVRVDLYDEARVFNRLLVAAWRDVQFPTQEEDGSCIENRLADRMRYHFSDGLVSSRRDRQERDLKLAKERMRVPGPVTTSCGSS